jgi:pimeloyl-ACP methyl ester carboxylesterase
MNRLIEAAKLQGPLVLVGHSLGGFNVKLFTALHRDKVAALLLVDPSEERGIERSRPFLLGKVGPAATAKLELAERDSFRSFVMKYQRCVAQAEAGELKDPAAYRRCSDPVRPKLGEAIAAERARLQPLPTYQRAQASEISSSIYGLREDDPTYAMLFKPGSFGALPMIVLTHGNYDPKDPESVLDFETWQRLHQETASLSSLGVQQVVPNSDHNIEIDQPQAIVAAVRTLLRRLR